MLTFNTPSRINVGSSPIENMHLMIADMTNVRTVEHRGIVITAARDMNIVVHTIPDIRPLSSVTRMHTHYIHTTEGLIQQQLIIDQPLPCTQPLL